MIVYVGTLGVEPGRRRALDFGCGAGRLAQGLARFFDEVDGVDISASMIDAAREHNAYPSRVRYHVNVAGDLALFDDDAFDLIYSNKVLQHIPPAHQAAYVAEFVRVLRPGGLAVFQARNGPRIESGTLRAWLYKLRREHFRRFWQRLRGRRPYEMHYMAASLVRERVVAEGGRIVDIVDLSVRRPGRSLRYAVTK